MWCRASVVTSDQSVSILIFYNITRVAFWCAGTQKKLYFEQWKNVLWCCFHVKAWFCGWEQNVIMCITWLTRWKGKMVSASIVFSVVEEIIMTFLSKVWGSLGIINFECINHYYTFERQPKMRDLSHLWPFRVPQFHMHASSWPWSKLSVQKESLNP